MASAISGTSALGDLLNAPTSPNSERLTGLKPDEAESFVETLKNKQSDEGTPSARKKEKPELMEAAQGLEGVFLNVLTQQMKDTVMQTDLMSGGRGEKMFRSMLYEEYANKIAHNKSLGLAETIYDQLS